MKRSRKADQAYVGAMKKSNSFKARKYKKAFILALILKLIGSHRQQDVFMDSHVVIKLLEHAHFSQMAKKNDGFSLQIS